MMWFNFDIAELLKNNEEFQVLYFFNLPICLLNWLLLDCRLGLESLSLALRSVGKRKKLLS
jgi:hypothetical protein